MLRSNNLKRISNLERPTLPQVDHSWRRNHSSLIPAWHTTKRGLTAFMFTMMVAPAPRVTGFVGRWPCVLASILITRDPQLSPEASSPAVGFDLPLPADENWPSKNVPSPHELQAHLGMGQSHQAAPPESDVRQPSPQRPKFGSDWNLSRQRQRRKLTAMSNSGTLPFPLDSEGRPKGLLKYGSRVRMKAR